MAEKRLLIIEDDQDVAEMLLMYFTSHQYEVYHADNGHVGIEIARTKFPHLILLDVMLPYMDGYEVCLRLRHASLTKHIPVIFLTQRDGRADVVEGLQLGADDYIPKPFDVDELRLRVQNSIERATRESLHEARTALPTGPMVEEERARHLEDNATEFKFEISGYDAFNDVYGFMASDDVMGFAARTIREAISQSGTPNDFVGIQGDHFIVLTHHEAPDGVIEALEAKFAEGVRAFYSFRDVDRGGVLINEGKDDERLVPLMTLRQLATQSKS